MLYEHSQIGQDWRIDDNGFLRITIRLISCGVMEYGREELGSDPQLVGLPDVVSVNVPSDAIFNPHAMQSIEGMPVIGGYHEWIEADEKRKNHEVGSVAGAARQSGPYLEVDLSIRDPDTIAKIKSGEFTEISSAYTAQYNVEPGDYEGVAYDVEQNVIRFNHVALLPSGEGRGGREVRILNKQSGAKAMDFTTIELADKRAIRVANSDATVLNGALAMHVHNEALNAQALEAAMNSAEEAKVEMTNAEKKLSEAMGIINELKARIDELTSGDTLENMAEEMAEEQMNSVDTLVDNDAYDDKEKATNSIKGLRGHKLRLHVVNAIRKEPLSDEFAKDESFVKGVFNTMRELTPTTKSKVAGSEVFNRDKSKVANKDSLGYSAYNKYKTGGK